MTDPNNPDRPAVPPVPGVPEIPPAAPTTPPPPAYGAPQMPPPASGGPAAGPYGQMGPAAKPAILSILSLVAGIIGIIGLPIAFVPFVGGIMALFLPAGAIVLGFLGKTREPQARGFWLTGIITGFVGVAIALLSLVIYGILFAGLSGGTLPAPRY